MCVVGGFLVDFLRFAHQSIEAVLATVPCVGI